MNRDKGHARAEENYMQVLGLGYDRFACLRMARIHSQRNRTDEALKLLRMILDREPGDPRAEAEYKALIVKEP